MPDQKHDGAERIRALDGVRVIDLTTVLMGPFASRLLADHGADVIRIEAPTTPRVLADDPDGVTAISLDSHRNKRSVIVDLKSEMGARATRELVASADIVITNMRAAALERLGLDAATLRAEQPALIHCTANGYGADGPYAGRAAYDDAIQALSGLAGLSQQVTGTPAYVPSVVVDKTCSLFIVQAVMAALLHRNATGDGQTIEVPMFETMASFVLIEHLRGAALIPQRGTIGYDRLLTANRRPYECADGWMAILPYTDANWRDFFTIIGRPELIDDPRFASHTQRVGNADALYATVIEAAPLHTVDEWMRLCDEHSIPANPVLGLDDLMTDEHLDAVGFMHTVEHPHIGPYRTIRNPVRYDTLSVDIHRHAPIPGEHTEEIFLGLGWSAAEVAALSEPDA